MGRVAPQYSISCKSDYTRACYLGETTDFYRRAGQHYKGLDDRWTNGVLFQHQQQHHLTQNLEKADLTLEVTSVQGRTIEQQAREGTLILVEETEEVRGIMIMNDQFP